MDPRFRRGNLVSIVKYISDRVQVSNSEIAGDLHMSMPTVLQHIKTLQTKGIVEETGKHRSSGGRRASLFTLKKDLAYAVGLDIKRDRQIFLIADMLGKTVYSCTCEVPYEDSFAYFEKIRRNLDAALAASGLQRSKVVGVGISLPGIVDVSRNLLLQSHALGVSNVSFQGVERLIGFPVKIENDANCAACAELRSYKGNAVYLSLSDTVGGAVFVAGALHKGDCFKSGEFGHMVIDKDGEQCYCGKRGCVDAYCSARVLKAAGGGDLNTFFARLKRGEENAANVWRRYADYLALSISNLRMMFDCDVIIGGEVGGYLKDYQIRLMELLGQYNKFEYDNGYIKIGKFKDDGSAYGASLLFREEFIENLFVRPERVADYSVM